MLIKAIRKYSLSIYLLCIILNIGIDNDLCAFFVIVTKCVRVWCLRGCVGAWVRGCVGAWVREYVGA